MIYLTEKFNIIFFCLSVNPGQHRPERINRFIKVGEILIYSLDKWVFKDSKDTI